MITLSSLYLCSIIGLPGIARLFHIRTGVSQTLDTFSSDSLHTDCDSFLATIIKPAA